MLDRVREQISAPTPIESKLEFVEVGVEMLCAQMMVGPDDGTLEQRKRALDRVGVDLAAYPFFFGVVHAVMRRLLVAGKPFVGRAVVGVDSLLPFGCVVFDESHQRAPVGTRADFQPN